MIRVAGLLACVVMAGCSSSTGSSPLEDAGNPLPDAGIVLEDAAADAGPADVGAPDVSEPVEAAVDAGVDAAPSGLICHTAFGDFTALSISCAAPDGGSQTWSPPEFAGEDAATNPCPVGSQCCAFDSHPSDSGVLDCLGTYAD